jgi:hypothetical protein
MCRSPAVPSTSGNAPRAERYSLYEELSDENVLRGMQVVGSEGHVIFKSRTIVIGLAA